MSINLTAVAVVAVLGAIVALLFAEARSSSSGILKAKMTASSLFVGLALLFGALDSLFGQLVLAGLVLSWFGDLFLVGKSDKAFIAGLSAFLLAHIAYAAAFTTQPLDTPGIVYVATAMAVVAGVVLRWLWPGIPASMKAPVVVYVIVIATMVTLAGGTTALWGPTLLLAAAVFAASDVFVARERFVQSALANRFLGLPLYYAAQLAFAFSVAGPGTR